MKLKVINAEWNFINVELQCKRYYGPRENHITKMQRWICSGHFREGTKRYKAV